MPQQRIFIINPAGEIRRTGSAYSWASYPRLQELAHEVFPPTDEEEDTSEFTAYNFWRQPMAVLPVPPAQEPPSLDVQKSESKSFRASSPAAVEQHVQGSARASAGGFGSSSDEAPAAAPSAGGSCESDGAVDAAAPPAELPPPPQRMR